MITVSIAEVPTLPTRLDDITPAWLTAAVAQRCPATVVEQVEIESVIWGTATKVFLRVSYSVAATGGPGQALCLKGGFDEKLNGVHNVGYRVEARFYRDIAPIIGGVPQCWFAAEDPLTGQGLVLIDDLRPSGAVFGKPEDQVGVDDVANCLELLARWHGMTWNRSSVGGLPWLTVGSELFRPVAETFLSPAHWAAFTDLPQTAAFDKPLRDRARLLRGLHALWQLDDSGPLALSHGDPHVGNSYVLPDGTRRFLDWQTVCLAPWSDDVAYFVTGILGVEDRRRHEIELLKHYLDAMSAFTDDVPQFDAAWLSYRQHHLHGLMFALCPPQMQSADVCAQMGQRYAAAAIDHQTLDALRV
jgi:hypothetical protein